MAKLLALMPFVPQVFSKLAGTPAQVRQLLTFTGSHIDAAGEAQHLHLWRMPSHVGATLSMMSQCNLSGLMRRLPQQTAPTLLITAANDRAVPNTVSHSAAADLPTARWVDIPGHGHLVHEEAAEPVASLIRAFLTEHTGPGA